MTNTLRSTTYALTIALTYLLQTAVPSTAALNDRSVPASVPTTSEPTSVEELRTDEQELVDFAYTRFALIGIELPDVRIEFPDDEAACHGYGGVYFPGERTVRICRPSKTTMIHELAHAWIETTFTDTDRNAFLEHRGLDTWAAGTQWDQRGAEHAAEIITWAAMDENISVRWLDTNTDGTTSETWRLYKLPNSNPDQLAAAYKHLTGHTPQLRLNDDPRHTQTTPEPTNPETRR